MASVSRWLKLRGLSDSQIRALHAASDGETCEGSGDEEEDTARLPHQREAAWRAERCSRLDAETLLCDQPPGTFLVRPNSTGQYALSVTCNDNVYHCIIYKTDKGYGFAEPYNIYRSLKALVVHYASNSLEVHNDSLTTKLLYPIFAQDPSPLLSSYARSVRSAQVPW